MIRAMLYRGDGRGLETGDETLLDTWSADAQSFIWIDFDSADAAVEREIMEQQFKLDPLALDDAQRERHPPKIEWFDGYFFLLLKAFTRDTDSIDYHIVHISFFVGRNFLVTRHAANSPSIDKVWAAARAGEEKMKLGPSHLCYRVVRTVINRYTPIILSLEKRLDELEESMLVDPSDDVLAELINYNSRLKKLRRIFQYQQTNLRELLAVSSPLFHKGARHEFQDAQEQMERLASLSALLQELTRDLIDGYISVTAHRLNNIMRILTIASVTFLPLTFLAGIYGMNFDHMPELHLEFGYFAVLGMMLVIALGMLGFFRRMNWM